MRALVQQWRELLCNKQSTTEGNSNKEVHHKGIPAKSITLPYINS